MVFGEARSSASSDLCSDLDSLNRYLQLGGLGPYRNRKTIEAPRLQTLCTRSLFKSMRRQDLKEVWVAAEVCGNEKLKQEVYNFLNQKWVNSARVKATIQNMAQTCPRYMINLVEHCVFAGIFDQEESDEESGGWMTEEEEQERSYIQFCRAHPQATPVGRPTIIYEVQRLKDICLKRVVPNLGVQQDSVLRAWIISDLMEMSPLDELRKAVFKYVLANWGEEDVEAAVRAVAKSFPQHLIELWIYAIKKMDEDGLLNRYWLRCDIDDMLGDGPEDDDDFDDAARANMMADLKLR